MKKILIALAAAALALTLTACGPSEQADMEEQAELAKTCQEAGGRYVLTIPPGYTLANYWCLWDEEREGGEW